MINFILFQIFSCSTYDIAIQNGFLSLIKKIFGSMSIYYNYLFLLLMKNIDNKNNIHLKHFCSFIFIIIGVLFTLYLYSFLSVTFKIIYNFIVYKISFKFINQSILIKLQDFFKHNNYNFSILNELLKSKKYLFSI